MTEPAPYSQYAAAPRTNTLSIIALVAAFVVPLAAIICGHIALGQIKRTGEQGHGLALAGTVLGYVFFVGGLLVAILYFVFVFSVVGAGALSGYSTY